MVGSWLSNRALALVLGVFGMVAVFESASADFVEKEDCHGVVGIAQNDGICAEATAITTRHESSFLDCAIEGAQITCTYDMTERGGGHGAWGGEGSVRGHISRAISWSPGDSDSVPNYVEIKHCVVGRTFSVTTEAKGTLEPVDATAIAEAECD